MKEFDCRQLLLDCGLSTRKATQLASSLRAAINKQANQMSNVKDCNCKEIDSDPVKINKVKKKDVNEVLDLRKKDKEEK